MIFSTYFLHWHHQRYIINFNREKLKSLNNVNNIIKIWVIIFISQTRWGKHFKTYQTLDYLFIAFLLDFLFFYFLIMILIYLFGNETLLLLQKTGKEERGLAKLWEIICQNHISTPQVSPPEFSQLCPKLPWWSWPGQLCIRFWSVKWGWSFTTQGCFQLQCKLKSSLLFFNDLTFEELMELDKPGFWFCSVPNMSRFWNIAVSLTPYEEKFSV